MKISEKLILFIQNETFVKDIVITKDTAVDADLGITGDDADDFIIAFSKEFNVDVSDFDIGKYFNGEGDKTISTIFNFLLKGTKEVKIKKTLLVADLERAITIGKLDDSVIENK